jgi:hypothetical protein
VGAAALAECFLNVPAHDSARSFFAKHVLARFPPAPGHELGARQLWEGIAMRRATKTPTTVHVGMLSEDVISLAAHVYSSLIDGPRLIWAEDDGRVYAGNLDAIDHIPPSWIAGSFAFGQPMIDIESDLRALQFERSKDWLAD